ncbi:MAG: hypothetical protein ABIP13_00550 [Tepidiformaceae bacterium]
MTRRQIAALLRIAVGPLAVAGFFLPWAHGPGVLAANQFTGFTLVGFAGRLQQLDLSLTVGGGLWTARLAILGVVIAGSWQTLLAPMHSWHPGYPASGWYLVVFSVLAAAIGVAKSGLTLPPLGLASVFASAAFFLIASRVTPRAAGAAQD